ncbi:DUF624 domain-containing protein [Microbacterium sp. KNMS]
MAATDVRGAAGEEAIGWSGRVMDVLGHVSRLLLVQGLWLGGALAGLVVLGVFPASVAAVRALEAPSAPVRAFVAAYREAFVRANLAGAGFQVAWLVVALDVAVSSSLPAGIASAALAAVTIVGAVSAVSAAYAVVALARAPRATTRTVLRFAVVAPWLTPGRALVVLAALGAVAAALLTAPPIALLFGASAPLLVHAALIGPAVDRATA